MTQLMHFREKQFIQDVLGPLVSTARPENFDDAVIIDLADVLSCPDAPLLAYSMDQPSFVRHADQSLDPYRFYGRWIAAVTCNDIVAVGGRCRGFSLALAAPPSTEAQDVVSLATGISEVVARYGASYEGGNLDVGPLATVGFAWGVVPRPALVLRSGARVGDVIAVSGELGLGWLEYHLRKNGLSDRVDPLDKDTFLRYKRMPVGAPDAIASVAERGWFTSGMDLSDGLVEFLYTINTRSDVGCLIDADALPVSTATRRNLPHLLPLVPELADTLRSRPHLVSLDPGYDSPLLHAFTVRPESFGDAQRVFAEHGAVLHAIGEVTAERTVRLREGRRVTDIPPFWDDQLRQEDILAAWSQFIRDLA